MRKNMQGQINVAGDMDSLAHSIVLDNDQDSVLEFLLAIDLAFADMGFSEDLFTRLAQSIAREGSESCDMEAIVAAARKAAK